jgi:bacterioferritin (cytochrome b1)
MKHKSHKYAEYKEDASLQENAGEIFEAMGYELNQLREDKEEFIKKLEKQSRDFEKAGRKS